MTRIQELFFLIDEALKSVLRHQAMLYREIEKLVKEQPKKDEAEEE